jgi:hypothetical protein
MKLIPGKIYRVKTAFWSEFINKPHDYYEIPEGVLLMYIEQKCGGDAKMYRFLLREEKIVFVKSDWMRLGDYFQSTDDWEM